MIYFFRYTYRHQGIPGRARTGDRIMTLANDTEGEKRLGVVGPGAMGLLHAAYLAQAGLPVTLVDHRRGRAQRLRQGFHLLRDLAEGGPLVSHLRCRPARDLKPPFKLLIFTVKACHTAQAAAQAAHLIGPDTVLLSLQNGLGNVEVLQHYQRPELVLAAVTTSGATRLEADTVIQRGLGVITLGSVGGNWALAQEVAQLFTGAGLPAEAVADIQPVLWRKLAINCAINPLTALLDLPNGLLPQTPAAELMAEVAREVGQVALAAGVPLDPEALPEIVSEVCRLTAENKSSMLQDVMAQRETEIDQINGGVARVAEQVGMPAPLNRALTALLKAHEWRREWAQQEQRSQREARRQRRVERKNLPAQETDE